MVVADRMLIRTSTTLGFGRYRALRENVEGDGILDGLFLSTGGVPPRVVGVVGRDEGWLEPPSEGVRGACCLLVLRDCRQREGRLMLAYSCSWFCGNSVHPVAAASIPAHRVR